MKLYNKTDQVDLAGEVAGMTAVVAVAEAEAAEVVGVEALLALALKPGRTRRRALDVVVHVLEGLAQAKAADLSHGPVPSHATALAPGSVARTPAPGPLQDLALN